MSADLRYPGLRPYQRSDSGRFFGRDDEAYVISEAWLRNRLTYVHGPAGIGKSSLVAAGVLPLVNRPHVELLPTGGFSRGSSSPVTPPGSHTPYTLALLRSWSPLGVGLDLDPFTVDEFVARRIRQLDPSTVVLAAIDQADDLFAGPPARRQQRQRFLHELADAMEFPALHLLICVRDEGLRRYSAVLGDAELVEVEALEPERAHKAVTGPGCFAPDTAQELITAIRTSRIISAADRSDQQVVVADRVEPALLQAVCARIWELLRRRTSMITLRELRRFGDIEAALAAHCGTVISAVAEAHSIQVPVLRFWLINTFVAETGGRQDAVEGDPVEGVAMTVGLPTAVAMALEDRHLLRARAGPSPAPSSSEPVHAFQLMSDRIIEPLRHAPDDLPADSDAAAYLLAGERAFTAGEFRLAERYAELALSAAPDTDLVLYGTVRSLLGNIAREERHLDMAEAHYREAVTLFTAAAQQLLAALSLMAIARIRFDRGDVHAGLSEMYAAVQRMPADATIQTELSSAVRELGWRLLGRNGPPRINPT